MKPNPMVLSVIRDTFAVCRIDAFKDIPDSVLGSSFFSVTRTADELSIICPEKNIPQESMAETSWRCLKIHGPLDFTTTGIISSLTTTLAQENISVFVFSTYDTDYIMIKDHDLNRAIDTLTKGGHQVHHDE